MGIKQKRTDWSSSFKRENPLVETETSLWKRRKRGGPTVPSLFSPFYPNLKGVYIQIYKSGRNYLQKTFSLMEASSIPCGTKWLTALHVKVRSLSNLVGANVRTDVLIFPSAESCKIERASPSCCSSYPVWVLWAGASTKVERDARADEEESIGREISEWPFC